MFEIINKFFNSLLLFCNKFYNFIYFNLNAFNQFIIIYPLLISLTVISVIIVIVNFLEMSAHEINESNIEKLNRKEDKLLIIMFLVILFFIFLSTILIIIYFYFLDKTKKIIL
jgi:hypothetical protein